MRILLGLSLAAALWGQEARSYRIFRGDGTAASLDDVVTKAKEASVLFLGESHDDPTGHLLELEILKRMKSDGPVALSLEMFESDVQPVLDEYLSGLITEEHLLASGRAWKNYKSDYRPMVEFAKAEKLPVVAANAPRRYVNRVSRLGALALAELQGSAKAVLPPLPYADASERYAIKFHDIMKKQQPDRKVDPVKSLAAQSLWDASMAHSIARALRQAPERKVVQVNGSFHSEDRLGILEHLERYRPGTRSVVVTMLSHKAFPEWQAELENKGDFVIVTDPALPRTMK
jgi:uncharacterized iron-regulated protein